MAAIIMADPIATGKDIQIDDGDYTRLHNLILEVLAQAHLTGLELRCVLFLLRRTYGWQRKEDMISLTQWEKGTDSTRANVIEALQSLLAKHVIYRVKLGISYSYGFNKYVEQWEPAIFHVKAPSQVASIPQDTSISGDTTSSIPQDTKTSIPGDTHKRKKDRKTDISSKPPEPKPTTEQQKYFDAVCKLVGWDYRVITKDQTGQVAQTVGILQKAEYTIEDLRKFWTYWRDEDWRGKKGQKPTLAQVRSEIGKIRPDPDDHPAPTQAAAVPTSFEDL